MKRLMLVLALVLGAGLVVPATTSAAPQAEAAATYWSAGSITEHTNYGGAMTSITFVQYGTCDSSGYYVNLNNLSGDWDARITTLYSKQEPNGCNRVKIYCKNGSEYVYSTASIFYARNGRGIDVPTPCNDAVNGLRWYRV